MPHLFVKNEHLVKFHGFYLSLPDSLTLLELEIKNCSTWLSQYELPHVKTNEMACAPSEDSDQPGRPPSLISLRCPNEESLGP